MTRVEDRMKMERKIWVKAGRPAPGTIAHAQVFPGKPHYIFNDGKWWYFKSLIGCRKFNFVRPKLLTEPLFNDH